MLGITPFKHLPRPMQIIMLINVVVYLLSFVGMENYVLWYGAFIPSLAHELWRFLSYAFIHKDFIHILFNMLMFWMFGVEVCKNLGERNFTALYLVSAVFAGLFSLPFYTFGVMGNSQIIGASGALFGIMVAYAFLFPERMILFFFVVPMKVKYAIWIFIAIDLLMANSSDGIAHYTHLGGVLSGYLFMLAWSKNQRKQETYSRSFFEERAQAQAQTQRKKPIEPLEGEFHTGNLNVKEERLNEILEKINRNGLQSLNQEERDYLQWFGQQNKKRR